MTTSLAACTLTACAASDLPSLSETVELYDAVGWSAIPRASFDAPCRRNAQRRDLQR